MYIYIKCIDIYCDKRPNISQNYISGAEGVASQ